MSQDSETFKPYELNIDLNVLNHLGLNLYSSVPAVLSELVANSWDADATRIDIKVYKNRRTKNPTSILVRDDGVGMSDADLRAKFLTIGYQRRSGQSGDVTPGKGRTVMGRKGIGKLSAFSIAGLVEIYSQHERDDPRAIQLNVEEIQKAIEADRKYHPKIIDFSPKTSFAESGTELRLRSLNRRVISSLGANLATRLSRRFSVTGKDFAIYLNGTELEFRYSHIFPKIEYVLTYGNADSLPLKSDDTTIVKRNNHIKVGCNSHCLKGWIGLVSESGALQDGEDNLNRISILARGKQALENMLEAYREGGLYTKYVIGELEADFLDATSAEDIATSSRQDFLDTDPRIRTLKTFVGNELKFLREERAKYKETTGTQTATTIPAVKNWYERLGRDGKRAARIIFGKINQIDAEPEHRKTLLKHCVLAFEHLRHKDKLSELSTVSAESLEDVVRIFADLDDIEATWYHEITTGRLRVIQKLSADVSANVIEKIIQEHISEHLWLLDPSWDRATETPTLERTVRAEFEKLSNKLSDTEKNGRIDIRYKKTSGKHVIIELKRSSVLLSDSELMNQVDKYVRALEKQIEEAGDAGDIEVVCLVGQPLRNWDTSDHKRDSEESLKAKNIRVVLYQTLIKDAETAYASYLEKGVERGNIQEVLNAIDAS